jgi:hypothetical protein
MIDCSCLDSLKNQLEGFKIHFIPKCVPHLARNPTPEAQ